MAQRWLSETLATRGQGDKAEKGCVGSPAALGRGPNTPGEGVAPPLVGAETPVGTSAADKRDEVDDPQPFGTAGTDVELPTEEVSALDTLVDLAVEQPRGAAARAVVTLPGPMSTARGPAPTAPRHIVVEDLYRITPDVAT